MSIKAGLRAGEIANLTWPMVVDPSEEKTDGWCCCFTLTLEHLPKRLNRGVSLRERIGFKVCAGVEASMDGETVFGGSAWARCWCGARWRYHPGNCGATWSEYQLCRALP